LAWDLGDSRGTVAVRMPLHPVALELLERTGPMAVSSANRSGQAAARTAEEAQDQLAGSVQVYLDGGPASVGVASTIVDVTTETPRVLREGAVTVEALRRVVPSVVA
jgi:tRNA threonylcarbamoyl adenosine modification protein (Sua5/YciO/YrdC/YwlC family)